MDAMQKEADFVADQCRFIRKMFRFTQENLADAAGITVRTVQKVESGRHIPDIQTLRSIARAVGLDVAVFTKPTPEQEQRQKAEIERALRKTVVVTTSPIRAPNDFYTRNRAWSGVMIDTSRVESPEALELAATIADWVTDLDGIWELSSHTQRLEYSTSVAELCTRLEQAAYVMHLGSFHQAHAQIRGLVAEVALLTFLPQDVGGGSRYAFVSLEDPWEVPEQDRPKL